MTLADFIDEISEKIPYAFTDRSVMNNVDIEWTDGATIRVGKVETHREFVKRTLKWDDERVDQAFDNPDELWLVTLTDTVPGPEEDSTC